MCAGAGVMGTLGCCSTSVPCTLRRVRQAPGGLALISRRPDPSVRSSRCLRTGRVSYPSSCCREVKRVRASPTEDSWGGDGEGLFAGPGTISEPAGEPALDSTGAPTDLVDAVLDVCEMPDTQWASSNAQCALDGEVNFGRGFVLTRAGFHRSNEPEALLAKSAPLPTQPSWLCYLWEPVFVPLDAVKASLSLFGPDLCAAVGMDRYGRIDPDERARRPVTPPWRAECGDYVCPLEPEEDDMWDLEGAGSQLMGSPVMHRLFPHAEEPLPNKRLSPNVDPEDMARLMACYSVSERDILFVLHYAESVLASPRTRLPECTVCPGNLAEVPRCEATLFDLLGMPHAEILAHVTGRSRAFRDLVKCRPLPAKSKQVMDTVLMSWEEEAGDETLPEECYVTYSSSEESDLEEWVKHEFHGGIPGPVSGAATPGADGYSSRDDHAALAAAVKAGKPLEGAMADMAKELRAASMEKASEVEVKVPQCAYDPTQGHYVYVVEGVVDSAKVPDEFRYWCVWGKTTSRRTIRGGRRTIKRVVR